MFFVMRRSLTHSPPLQKLICAHGEPRATLDVDILIRKEDQWCFSLVTVPTSSMKDLNNDSKNEQLHETPSTYALELPVDPTFNSKPPKGNWEDGYNLSLLALEQVKDRPEIFERRARRMCDVEFIL